MNVCVCVCVCTSIIHNTRARAWAPDTCYVPSMRIDCIFCHCCLMPPAIVVCLPATRKGIWDISDQPVSNVPPWAPALAASRRGFTFFFFSCLGSGNHFGSFSSLWQAHHVASRRISSPEHRNSMALWGRRFFGLADFVAILRSLTRP